MRADEGILARWYKDNNGSLVATGAVNAYAVAANRTITAYYDGLDITFEANLENTGSATLNVDGVGAKTIRRNNDKNLTAGDIEAGQKVSVLFDSDNDVWQMMSQTAGEVPRLDENNVWTGTNEFQQAVTIDEVGSLADLLLRSDVSTEGQIAARIRFQGDDELGNPAGYGLIYATVVDNTQGTEDGDVRLANRRNNVEVVSLIAGPGGVYTPGATGGDPGADKINTSGYQQDGVDLKSPVLVFDQTTTSGTTVEITWAAVQYRKIEIQISGLVPSADGEIRARFSGNDGSTWDNGASDYRWYVNGIVGGSFINAFDDTSDFIQLCQQGADDIESTGLGYNAHIILTNPEDSGIASSLIASTTYERAFAANSLVQLDAAGFRTTAKRINGVQFLWESTQTFAGGRITAWGFPV